MIEELLKKRREKRNRHKWLKRCRKIVFVLVFFLLFFGYPNFIDKESVGGSIEPEQSLEMGQETGLPTGDLTSEKQEVFVEANQKETVETNKKASEQTTEKEEKTQTTPIEVSEKVTRKETGKKIVYLTFDDGPTKYLPMILNILSEYEARATFFLLEPHMEAHLDTLNLIKDEGHAFGLHGVTHNRRNFYASAESVLGEMKQAQQKLRELIGIETVLIRVPYGSKPYMTPAYREAVEAAGFKMWDWNVDSRDWYYRDARSVDYTIQQIEALAQRRIDPVILLHDRRETCLFLPQLLEYLKSNNYIFEVLTGEMEPVQF